MTDMCYMSDYRKCKGYCVIIASRGRYYHGIELGKNYFSAAKKMEEWAESNGWERAEDYTPVWFKEGGVLQ